MDRELRTFPEVARVFGKIGRAESATDPAPLGMVETVVVLKPREEWRAGLTWDGLIAEMDAKLSLPRACPTSGGCRSRRAPRCSPPASAAPLGVKVFGDDLAADRARRDRDRGGARRRPGHAQRLRRARDRRLLPRRRASTARRRRATASGWSTCNDVVATAIGGLAIAETIEGRERYPIAVRYARDFRDDPTRLERVLVATPSGAQVPLAQVARLELRHRAADGPQRGRPAGRLRLRRPRRAPARRLRRGGAPGRGRTGGAAGRRAHRVGRAVPATTSAPASGSRSWCR